jgi:hypothetical protein
MTDQPEVERIDCTDCCALPDPDTNTRMTSAQAGGGITEIWHTPDCPALTIMQINWEESSRRIKEEEAWAEGVFPAAHERLKQAAAAMPPATAAQPFIDALTELVQAQASASGFVVLAEWAAILDRHFPQALPDPDHTTDQG